VGSSRAVKTAYDKGVEAKNAADNAKNAADAAQRTANAKQSPATTLAGYGITDAIARTAISDAVNSTSQTTVGSSRAVKTAYDKGVEALNKANQLESTTLKKSGDQSINGILKAEGGNGRWAAFQLGTEQGLWQFEVHPKSHLQESRRFNIFYRAKNANNGIYLSFPHIHDDSDVVAYQRWVNERLDKKVNKSGDTMTGNLLVKSGDYSSLRTYNTAGVSVRWESASESSNHFAAIVRADNKESVTNSVFIPKKNGTVLLDGDFTQSLSQNGWCRLPNGLLIQWGVSHNGQIIFPIAFPNQCFVVSHSKTGGGRDTRVYDVTNTGFQSHASGPVGTTYYIALGR
ncbi:gp53-like domain-containing protein, partial [Ursidibacter sp. B-7004-1]